jgi:hypothetical protein
MNDALQLVKTEYIGRHRCKLCGHEFSFQVDDLEIEQECSDCNSFETVRKEDIEEICYHLHSPSLKYSTSVTLFVNHEKKELFPGKMGANYRVPWNYSWTAIAKDVIEFLQNKGTDLTNENLWKEYNFVKDYNRISGV